MPAPLQEDVRRVTLVAEQTSLKEHAMLQANWKDRKPSYDFVVIGSGYGGAITAARLATANLNPKPSVCILERGKEWSVGEFPETLDGVRRAVRQTGNPLGLYELLTHSDITVIKGSGLGGTSLINANVAIVPDPEIFEQSSWPQSITYPAMERYYERASKVLAVEQHPQALKLAKVRALERRAQEIGTSAEPLNIAVNFSIKGTNPHNVQQEPCNNCGNCVTGCNVGAKNTLYMNYLPMAKNAGATIFTQTKVEWLEKRGDGGWRIHGRHYDDNGDGQSFTMDAGEIVLCAGSMNSTEILLRSEMHGLSVSPAGSWLPVQRKR
jgi:cholesterol oxidase